MFAKLFSVVLAVAAFAAAAPTGSVNQCNTGQIQCCNSVQSSQSLGSGLLSGLTLIGALVQGVNVPVGLTCSPITAVGLGSGSSCVSQPVCCQNNSFNGLVAIGCTPINIAL